LNIFRSRKSSAVIWALACAALLLTAACSRDQSEQGGAEAKQEKATAAAVPSKSQADILKTVTQSQGKVVVLNFWATWCDPCRTEIKDLKELRTQYAEDELVIHGYSVDRDPGAVAAFARKADFNYPVYMATEGAARFFKIEAIPRLMLYDKTGELKVNAEGVANPDRLREIIDSLLAE